MTTQMHTLPPSSTVRTWSLRNVYSRTVAERLLLASLVALGLGLMGLALGPLYESMGAGLADLATGLPTSVSVIFGDFGTGLGFVNVEMYSIWAPAILIYVALVIAARSFAAEIEDHTIGLLAANPISRSSLAISKIAAMFTLVALMCFGTGLGVWLGSLVSSLGIPTAGVVAVNVHMGLFVTAVGLLTVITAVLSGRRVLSMIVGTGVALVAYAWASFAPLSEGLADWAWLSPWHWYYGSNPLANGFDWPALAALLGLNFVLFVIALLAFRRRDLPG
ncbi:MAG: ABC transporter permease [Actinomycetia bacterium]|nr:ABC transporter permease [Actinomycetes bacterium]